MCSFIYDGTSRTLSKEGKKNWEDIDWNKKSTAPGRINVEWKYTWWDKIKSWIRVRVLGKDNSAEGGYMRAAQKALDLKKDEIFIKAALGKQISQ